MAQCTQIDMSIFDASATDTFDDTSVILLITFYMILQIKKQLTYRFRLPSVTGITPCLDSWGFLNLFAILP